MTLAGKADAADIGNVTALHADHTITLDAHAMTHALKVSGSIADDTIETGSGDDTIIGGTGADSLTGNAGADSFKYTSAGDSVLQVFGDISPGSLGFGRWQFIHGESLLFAGLAADVGTDGIGSEVARGLMQPTG